MSQRTELARVPNLRRIILELLLQIPKGMVTTYKDIAVALGDSAAARAVGTVMASNKDPETYPCWRVVYSDGRVGNYSGQGGTDAKKSKMRNEGIAIENGRIIDFSRVRFSDFELDPPLPELRETQLELEGFVEKMRVDDVNNVAGVDVSYGGDGVVGSYVEMGPSEGSVVCRQTISRDEVNFPYIPGYLAFRELPIIHELLDSVRKERALADVLFVDGNGLLHPRGAGLATHLGITENITTIGVAKKLLCGVVSTEGMVKGERRDVVVNGEKIGLALKSYERANPIYVSVGNKITLEQAGDLANDWSTYKLPEPIRQAHKFAKSLAT